MEVAVDKNLGEEATKVFERAGLSLKEAVDMFLREVVKKDAVPFENDKKEKDDGFEFYKGDSPNIIATREAARDLKGKAKEAGFKTEEEFNDYFFNEFRPAFLKEWKKEQGYA